MDDDQKAELKKIFDELCAAPKGEIAKDPKLAKICNADELQKLTQKSGKTIEAAEKCLRAANDDTTREGLKTKISAAKDASIMCTLSQNFDSGECKDLETKNTSLIEVLSKPPLNSIACQAPKNSGQGLQ